MVGTAMNRVMLRGRPGVTGLNSVAHTCRTAGTMTQWNKSGSHYTERAQKILFGVYVVLIYLVWK